MSDVLELKERLRSIQQRLDARGVRNIKFAMAPGEHTFSEMAEDICNALEQFLDGRVTPLPPFGDSVRLTPPPGSDGEGRVSDCCLAHLTPAGLCAKCGEQSEPHQHKFNQYTARCECGAYAPDRSA